MKVPTQSLTLLTRYVFPLNWNSGTTLVYNIKNCQTFTSVTVSNKCIRVSPAIQLAFKANISLQDGIHVVAA